MLSIKETAEFVKISINGLSTSQRKIDREPDKSCACWGRCSTPICFQNHREISADLLGKILQVDSPVAERFYALYREQFNRDLTVPDSVVEEWISVGTFRPKEKITAKPQQVIDLDVCRKRPTLMIESKT